MEKYFEGPDDLREEYQDLNEKLETGLRMAFRKLTYGTLTSHLLIEQHRILYGEVQLNEFIKHWDSGMPVYRKHSHEFEKPLTLFEKKLRDVDETIRIVEEVARFFGKESREIEKVMVVMATVLLNSIFVHASDEAERSDMEELKTIFLGHLRELEYSLFLSMSRSRKASLEMIRDGCFRELDAFFALSRHHLGNAERDFRIALGKFVPGTGESQELTRCLLDERSARSAGALRFLVGASVLTVFSLGLVFLGQKPPVGLTEVQGAILRSSQFLAPLGGISLAYAVYHLHRVIR